MHLAYGAANCNAAEAARLYAERFPGRDVPDRRYFQEVDRRLGETGNLQVKRVLKSVELGRFRGTFLHLGGLPDYDDMFTFATLLSFVGRQRKGSGCASAGSGGGQCSCQSRRQPAHEHAQGCFGGGVLAC